MELIFMLIRSSNEFNRNIPKKEFVKFDESWYLNINNKQAYGFVIS